LDEIPNTAIAGRNRKLAPAIAILDNRATAWSDHDIPGNHVGALEQLCVNNQGSLLARSHYESFVSANLGDSWQSVTLGGSRDLSISENVIPSAISCLQGASRWFVVMDNGELFVSDNSQDWHSKGLVLAKRSTCTKLDFDSRGRGLALCGEVLLTTDDWGTRWSATNYASVIDFYIDDVGTAHVLENGTSLIKRIKGMAITRVEP
jgi:hypothetical protein